MIAPAERLYDPLPAEPLEVAAEWLAEAWRLGAQRNPNAMTLATSTRDGRPSARIVLCKEIVARPGYVVFYTNYHSRKGRELAQNPRAAAVFHFDALQCQVRLEGRVEKAPEADSDAYFASRSVASRLSAWASAQSAPIESREKLRTAVDAAARRFGASGVSPERPPGAADMFVPRPPHWGGYRLWAEGVELWVEGANRIHDRARWSRELRQRADGRIEAGAWSVTRLQP
ncbi:MAG TPA: pyridoxamine 5'-phosphate oxidase [Steroidobacteraceae bacterium]|nr:pyridoxamine 5'-phosphate oxidase [Steroidobacteraceae bacterium]